MKGSKFTLRVCITDNPDNNYYQEIREALENTGGFLGDGVSFGNNIQFGGGVKIENNVSLGQELKLGEGCVIKEGVALLHGSEIPPNTVVQRAFHSEELITVRNGKVEVLSKVKYITNKGSYSTACETWRPSVANGIVGNFLQGSKSQERRYWKTLGYIPLK